MTDTAATPDVLRVLFSNRTADDPHPVYEQLRAECPVARREGGSWRTDAGTKPRSWNVQPKSAARERRGEAVAGT